MTRILSPIHANDRKSYVTTEAKLCACCPKVAMEAYEPMTTETERMKIPPNALARSALRYPLMVFTETGPATMSPPRYL